MTPGQFTRVATGDPVCFTGFEHHANTSPETQAGRVFDLPDEAVTPAVEDGMLTAPRVTRSVMPTRSCRLAS